MSKFTRQEVAHGQRRWGPVRQMFNETHDAVRALRWTGGRAGQRVAAVELVLPELKRSVVRMEAGRMPVETQLFVASVLNEGRLAMRKVKAARMSHRSRPEQSTVFRDQALIHLLRMNRMVSQ